MVNEPSKQQTSTDKRLANLKPQWKPGESGNLAGRPKSSIISILKEKLGERTEGGRTKAENIADILYEMATSKGARGQMPALIELLDRIEGKVTEKRLTLSLTATVTPELLEQAQKRLTASLSDTQELLKEE